MRRSTRIAEKQAKVENDFQREPKAEKKRSNAKVTAIAVMDNGTMVQAFKYLNYCQLAKNSLVSKRFRNLIRTHRHSLALLYVDAIGMVSVLLSYIVQSTLVYRKRFILPISFR
ncbi:hypothetical protein DdX_22405 [Ditylenchus destructor]|uniref:F-box domain-containing protein n=1 Tax=Ditylenchus destructor TaxID=166010 RepID=A0AAD4QUQ5_9BILA|nr:hypothetical protein DdX_22405 [Ditylenchus destructor]